MASVGIDSPLAADRVHDSSTYLGRRAARLENELLRITVTIEGGHIAEIFHKPSSVNPLWTPPWRSIEPSQYRRDRHPEYGEDDEAALLAGIMGHNICLDTYGAPSAEEFRAGIPIHGEGPMVPYEATGNGASMTLRAHLPKAELQFTRVIRLLPDVAVVCFSETIENLSYSDRPIAWTQHVTLGPPFLERGATQFRAPVTRSKVIDADFTGNRGFQKRGADFEWPFCPRADGGFIDLRVFPDDPVSGGFTIHAVDATQEHGHFIAWSPRVKLAFGYIWHRQNFPWLCRWEENHLRSQPPWNGQVLTCAMEFGVSPVLESRRQMVERGKFFDIPAYKWVPAKSAIHAEYRAFFAPTESIPEVVTWDGNDSVQVV